MHDIKKDEAETKPNKKKFFNDTPLPWYWFIFWGLISMLVFYCIFFFIFFF
ncbi:MAG: hypothetical protein WCR67_00325 [Bacilli bacterium]